MRAPQSTGLGPGFCCSLQLNLRVLRHEHRAPLLEYWKSQNGQQSGDPAKLARAIVTIASQEPPPLRFIAGADAIAGAEQKIADLKAQIDAYRDLSTSLSFDEMK